MVTEIIGAISGFMYSKLLIILLLGAGIYFTFRTGFVQFRLFGESVRVVSEKPDKEGSVSSFQALMVSTASRVGNGCLPGRLRLCVLDVDHRPDRRCFGFH